MGWDAALTMNTLRCIARLFQRNTVLQITHSYQQTAHTHTPSTSTRAARVCYEYWRDMLLLMSL